MLRHRLDRDVGRVKAHPIDRHPGPQARRASFDVAHFRSCPEGGGQQISSGNRSGGGRHRRRGHAATAWRSARVSRPRRLTRPTGLPRSSQNQVSEVFVLAKLTPNVGDLSVEHWGGVMRPTPSKVLTFGLSLIQQPRRRRVLTSFILPRLLPRPGGLRLAMRERVLPQIRLARHLLEQFHKLRQA